MLTCKPQKFRQCIYPLFTVDAKNLIIPTRQIEAWENISPVVRTDKSVQHAAHEQKFYGPRNVVVLEQSEAGAMVSLRNSFKFIKLQKNFSDL